MSTFYVLRVNCHFCGILSCSWTFQRTRMLNKGFLFIIHPQTETSAFPSVGDSLLRSASRRHYMFLLPSEHTLMHLNYRDVVAKRRIQVFNFLGWWFITQQPHPSSADSHQNHSFTKTKCRVHIILCAATNYRLTHSSRV